MHFWIDKRSQTCGFGRARVAASLSGGGLGFGPHHPRRVRSKSIVTPVQRFQAIECNNTNTTTTQNSRQSHINQTTQQHHHHQQPQQVHRSQGHHHQSQQQQHHHHHQPSYNSQIITTNPYQSAQQNYLQQQQQNVCYQPYYSHAIQQQPAQPQQQQQSVIPVAVSVPVSLSHIYGRSSHSSDLEHGNLGIAALSTSPNISSQVRQHSLGNQIQISSNQASIQQQAQQVAQPQIQITQQHPQQQQQQQHQQPQPQPESVQLLPAHLKCGMWASLALATVFVAGAKFYFDHQGTGLEVLIFCAFSATFFFAACTVSLCRRPRDLQLPPSITTADAQALERLNSNSNNPNTPGDIVGLTAQNNALNAAPPPPYHIAILLPETSKDMDEETPPPSYDKIVI